MKRFIQITTVILVALLIAFVVTFGKCEKYEPKGMQRIEMQKSK